MKFTVFFFCGGSLKSSHRWQVGLKTTHTMGGGGSKSKQKVAPAAESLPAAAASSVPAVDPAASPAPAPPSQLPPPEAHQPSPAPSETTPAPSPDIRTASLSPLQTDQSIFGDDANYPTHDEEEGGNDFVAMQTSPTIADGIAAIDESAAAVHDTTIVDTGDDARSDDGEGLTAVPVPLQHPGPTTPATASPEPEGEGDDAAVAINSHLALSVGDLKIGSDETTDTGGSAGGNGNGYANGDLVGTKVGIFPPQDDGSADGDGGNNTSGDSVPGSRPTAAVEVGGFYRVFVWRWHPARVLLHRPHTRH